MARATQRRVCEWPGGCNNAVSAANWEVNGHRCHIHVGKKFSDATAILSANPFVDASVVFPDLLEKNYSALFRVPDHAPKAQSVQRMASLISNVHTADGSSIGTTNARAIATTHALWTRGADLSVPDIARKRYRKGAQLYFDLLTKSDKLRNCSAVHLVQMKDLTIRPRVSSDSKEIVNKNTGQAFDLFAPQRFNDRRHTVVMIDLKRGADDHATDRFVIDPMISALAPVKNGSVSVMRNRHLQGTPFTESPWVSSIDDYRDIERNGSLNWNAAEILKTRKG